MNNEIKTRLAQIRAGEIPQGYKNTPIGILKSDWSNAKLYEIAEILTETAGKNQYETLSISAGIGFVNQAKKFGKELSGKQYEKYIVLRKGDFSYNKGNSKAYPQGCIYRLNDREEAAVPNVFESFRIAKGCPEYYEQLFIAGFLNSQLYRFINHGVRDDGLLNLTERDFYSCIVPVPPLEEQKKIADILSTQDKIIELCERKLEQLKRMKKYYLQKMFPKDGEEYPEIRFKGFTEAWEKRKLREVLKERTERAKGNEELLSVTISNGVIRQSDLDKKNIASEDKSNYKIVCKGDVPYNSMRMWQGAVGNSEYDGIVSPAYTVLVPTNEANDKFFMELFKKNSSLQIFQRWSQGLTSDTWNLKYPTLSSISFNLPLVEEQRKMAEYFQTFDDLITLNQRKCEEEKKKKKALQQLLLTGIVRV